MYIFLFVKINFLIPYIYLFKLLYQNNLFWYIDISLLINHFYKIFQKFEWHVLVLTKLISFFILTGPCAARLVTDRISGVVFWTKFFPLSSLSGSLDFLKDEMDENIFKVYLFYSKTNINSTEFVLYVS